MLRAFFMVKRLKLGLILKDKLDFLIVYNCLVKQD